MSNTPRELNLKWGEHERSEKIHIEWHAPCGCAYHPEPYLHIHPCRKHLKQRISDITKRCD